MNKVSVKESCTRCRSWECLTLSDDRSVMATDHASTFIKGSIVECSKRMNELLADTNILYGGISNELEL